MLSRAADNLYWFGRYLQRAENTARIVSVHQFLLLDLPRHVEFGWSPLVEILGASASFHARYPDSSEANVVRFLLIDREHSGSILSSLHAAREILRTIRENMPRDLWERFNDLYYELLERGERQLPRGKRQDLLAKVTERTDAPVIASGGVSSLDDLRAIATLTGRGVEGAIVGKALYAGRFTLPQALAAVNT